jgi:hypothetical protein
MLVYIEQPAKSVHSAAQASAYFIVDFPVSTFLPLSLIESSLQFFLASFAKSTSSVGNNIFQQQLAV